MENSTYDTVLQSLRLQNSGWELANDPLQPLEENLTRTTRYLRNVFYVILFPLIGLLAIVDGFRSKVNKQKVEQTLDKLYSKGVPEKAITLRILASMLGNLNKVLILLSVINLSVQRIIYAALGFPPVTNAFVFSLKIQLVFAGFLNLFFAIIYIVRYRSVFSKIKKSHSSTGLEGLYNRDRKNLEDFLPRSKVIKGLKKFGAFVGLLFAFFVLSLPLFIPLQTLQKNENFFEYGSPQMDFAPVNNWHQIMGFLPFFIYPALFIFPIVLFKLAKKTRSLILDKSRKKTAKLNFNKVFSRLFHTSGKFREQYLLVFMILISIVISFNNISATNQDYDRARAKAAFGPDIKCIPRNLDESSNFSHFKPLTPETLLENIEGIQNVSVIKTKIGARGAALEVREYLATVDKTQIKLQKTNDMGAENHPKSKIDEVFDRVHENTSCVILSSKYALREEIEVDQKIPVAFSNGSESTTKTFKVVGIADYLPGIDLSEDEIIFNDELTLIEQYNMGDDKNGEIYFIKAEKNQELESIRSEIIEKYAFEFISVDVYDYQQDINLYFLEILNYLSWALIIIFGAIQFSLFTIELNSFKSKTEQMHVYGYSKAKTKERIWKDLIRENGLYLAITLGYSIFLTYYLYKYQAIQFLFDINYINPFNGLFGSSRISSDGAMSASYPYTFGLEPIVFILIGIMCLYFFGYFSWYYVKEIQQRTKTKEIEK